MPTYYELLQVDRNASDIVIRASYRALLQKYHPDKFDDRVRGEQISRNINEAYAVLSDPVRRAQYDSKLKEDTPDSVPENQPPTTPPESERPHSQEAKPQPETHNHVKRQGMRWATWSIFIRYPLGGVILLSSSLVRPIMSLVFLPLAALFFATSWQLLKLRRLGWKMNWALLVIELLSLSIPTTGGGTGEWIGRLIGGAIFYTGPQSLYWAKRKKIFSNQNNEVFNPDWRQAWVPIVPIGLAILAAIAIPAYQGYVKQSTDRTPQQASVDNGPWNSHKSTAAPNIVDPFEPASSQAKKSNMLDPIDTSKVRWDQPNALKPFTGKLDDPKQSSIPVQSATQEANQVALQEALDARAHEWYGQYPFLDIQSPLANNAAINAVVARRDQLVGSGLGIIAALDQAVQEIAPQYTDRSNTTAPMSTPGNSDTVDSRPRWEQDICPRPYNYVQDRDRCCMNADINEKCVSPKY